MPCQQCGDGRWECGPEGMLCGPAGEPPPFLGVAYVPVGIGTLQVGVEVYAECVPVKKGKRVVYKPIVRIKQYCPDQCHPHVVVHPQRMEEDGE